MSHCDSESPMRWHANAGALNIEQLLKTAISSHTEQRLNAYQPFHGLLLPQFCQKS